MLSTASFPYDIDYLITFSGSVTTFFVDALALLILFKVIFIACPLALSSYTLPLRCLGLFLTVLNFSNPIFLLPRLLIN